MFEKIKNFVETEGKLPNMCSKILEEKSLGIWCSGQRTSYKSQKLSDDKIIQLESIYIWKWSLK